MSATENMLQHRGRSAVDRDGDKLGKIEEIYLDQETDRPEWALVSTGLFGGKSTFVPLAGATVERDFVRLAYEKDQIKSAPQAEADGELSLDEEAALYRHYGLDYSEGRSESGLPEGEASRGDLGELSGRSQDAVGNDVSGPETDDAMTRSEEELRVGTTQREAGRARLRKHVVTEEVTKTVPVTREEVTLEREPITGANVSDATAGPDISDEEHEVTLMEEEVVVEKRAVPKERVRLGKETVSEERQVSEEVRREEIEMVDAEGAPERGHDGERQTDEGIDRR
jgi:uncharacterized protein (TIGR02271 family)